MRDGAVSPVVAFMLLLMVVVSFISVLNAYYIPSLKQQAEIEHLQGVEQSFLKLSSDILQVLAFRQNVSMSESIQLGGGGVFFSPIQSSGYLEVNTSIQSQSLVMVLVKLSDYDPSYKAEINRTKIAYRPVGNFWIDQGYEWEDGVIQVTKGKKSTCLSIDDENLSRERNLYYQMLSPRVNFEEYQNNITAIAIDLVHTQNPGNYQTYNGNGAGKITVELAHSCAYPDMKNHSLKNGTILSFSFTGSDPDFLGWRSIINDSFNESCRGKNNVYWNSETFSLQILDESTVYPNLTINVWNLSMHV